MKITEPKLEDRKVQHYVGIRSHVLMKELPDVIPQHIDEVIEWLAQQGVEPDGPPLLRYHACPTIPGPDAELEISVGWPVAVTLVGNRRITADILPAGRYASLIYSGVENGIKGNAALIEWANAQGLQWDRWDAANGDAFAGRVEYMLDGPEDDPDPANWNTEVAIKLADGQD